LAAKGHCPGAFKIRRGKASQGTAVNRGSHKRAPQGIDLSLSPSHPTVLKRRRLAEMTPPNKKGRGGLPT